MCATDDTLISGMTRAGGLAPITAAGAPCRDAAVPGSPDGTPPRRAFSLKFCFADRDAATGITPILTPGGRMRLAQSPPPGPAAGKLAAQGRPSVYGRG